MTRIKLSPSSSSWGHKGYWEVWLDQSNARLSSPRGAARMTNGARASGHESGIGHARCGKWSRVVARAIGQLGFLMKTGTAGQYAAKHAIILRYHLRPGARARR
jgi:1,4-alpha-glucan branching enzyme